MRLAKPNAVAAIMGAVVSALIILILWFGLIAHAQVSDLFIGLSGSSGACSSAYLGVEFQHTLLMVRANAQHAGVMLCASGTIAPGWFARMGFGPCWGETSMLDAAVFAKVDKGTYLGAGVAVTEKSASVMVSVELHPGSE